MSLDRLLVSEGERYGRNGKDPAVVQFEISAIIITRTVAKYGHLYCILRNRRY